MDTDDVSDREDGGSLADMLVELGKAAEESAGTLKEGLGNAEVTVREGIEQAEDTIREHPLMAIGIAAGLGFVLGLLLRGAGAGDDE